jgi:hypothetical protein
LGRLDEARGSIKRLRAVVPVLVPDALALNLSYTRGWRTAASSGCGPGNQIAPSSMSRTRCVLARARVSYLRTPEQRELYLSGLRLAMGEPA